MRALRIALLALVSLSVLDASATFAKGTGGAAGGGGAGAGAGAGGGSSGGAGTGSNPLTYYVIPGQEGHRQRPVYIPGKVLSSCFKQETLYNRYGYAVVNVHGAECFQ